MEIEFFLVEKAFVTDVQKCNVNRNSVKTYLQHVGFI